MPDTALPGVSDTALPGVSDTALPGVSDTALPGVSDTALPGVPDTALPGVSDTALPGVSVEQMRHMVYPFSIKTKDEGTYKCLNTFFKEKEANLYFHNITKYVPHLYWDSQFPSQSLAWPKTIFYSPVFSTSNFLKPGASCSEYC